MITQAPAGAWTRRTTPGGVHLVSASQANSSTSLTSDALTDRRVAYEDFTTIDWIYDLTRERIHAEERRRIPGWKGVYVRAITSSQMWIVVVLVGLATGWLAGIIDIASNWLEDVKEGYCSAGFYLSRKFCCWHRPENEYCQEWIAWSTVMGVSGSFLAWLIECIFYTFWGVLFATSASFLVKVYAPHATGEGIPEIKTILGGFVMRRVLGLWTLLIKCLGIVLSVGSGLSLGKEGPLIHIACCLGNSFPALFGKYQCTEAKKREILSASSAAGISVAFGAPVGGVLFSLEEISYYFPFKTMWRSFLCAMVAALALKMIDPFRTGKLVWFQVEFSRDWHPFELPVFVLLGIIGGLCGTLFIQLNRKVMIARKESIFADKPIYEVAVIALATGVISYSHVFLRAPIVDLVANLFRECADVDGDFHGLCNTSRSASVVFLLFFAALIKFVLTVVTYGALIPAGLFTPTIAIGACVGRAFGIIIQKIQESNPNSVIFWTCDPNKQCVTPATYAVVGAAAFLSGVTRITISLSIIMFELTGALSYVLPIIITVLTAKWVGDYGSKGIYDCLIALNGYPFLNVSDEYVGEETVQEVMTPFEELELIEKEDLNVATLKSILEQTRFKGYPVVTSKSKRELIGFIGRAELRHALRNFDKQHHHGLGQAEGSILEPAAMVNIHPWVQHTPTTIPVEFPVELSVELFKKTGLRQALVTTHGKLVGIVTKKDILQHIQ